MAVVIAAVKTWRSGWRPWRGRLGLAATIVASLALAMALSMVMSAIRDTIQRQADVYPNGRYLVRPVQIAKDSAGLADVMPAPAFGDWRAQTDAFADLAAYQRAELSLRIDGQSSTRIAAARISGNLMRTLGVRVVSGRELTEIDETVTPCSAVLTTRAARRLFGSTDGALDRGISLDRDPCRVVGVVAERYAFPSSDVDVWAPLNPRVLLRRDALGRMTVSITQVQIIGRPREGASVEQLAAEATKFFEAPSQVRKLNDDLTLSYRQALDVLWLCSLLVLTVATFNVSAVMATHSLSRLGEWSLKGALGASRLTLWREAVREGAVVCFTGGIVGALLAAGGLAVLRSSGLIELTDASVAWPTALAWIVVIGLLMVLAPIPAWLQASRLALAGNAGPGRSTSGRRDRSRMGSTLLVLQVAFAITLVSIALLFGSTLKRAFVSPRGFDADDVVMLPTYRGESNDELDGYLDDVDRSAQALRSLESDVDVAVAAEMPVPTAARALSIRSDDEARGVVMHGDLGSARVSAVGPGFFRVMKTRIIAGREFAATDGKGSAPVVVVSATLASAWLGGPSAALGKVIRVSALELPAIVVGVAADVRRSAWESRELPVIYVHYRQVSATRHVSSRALNLVLLYREPNGTPDTSLQRLKQTVRQIAPRVQAGEPRSIQSARFQEVTQMASYLGLAGLFSVVMLFLIALGVFAATASLVARKTTELAIRQAVGASPVGASAVIARAVLRWWGAAALAGAISSIFGARALSAVQSGVSSLSVPTLLGSVALITATMVIAAALPLRRALRVDPITLLKTD